MPLPIAAKVATTNCIRFNEVNVPASNLCYADAQTGRSARRSRCGVRLPRFCDEYCGASPVSQENTGVGQPCMDGQQRRSRTPQRLRRMTFVLSGMTSAASTPLQHGRSAADPLPRDFPIEGGSRLLRTEGVHSGRFEDLPVGDRVLNPLGVADLVLGMGACFTNQDVRELADFQRAEIAVQPEITGAVQRAAAQRLASASSRLERSSTFPNACRCRPVDRGRRPAPNHRHATTCLAISATRMWL